ncbi:hypothetical protein JD276_12370 [Leucobacter sp. CSA1]|uniref:Uncharacterized protein n=1 Tax=Leucobacter chromiisoli TaxID=2796471 RepID=A0A934QAX5_9MICO|nr:hypothetical protein [Leucobacter chromiisoli]MBK0419829.1 hypothetical protein [Leucobacter chromiisoli]
MNDDTAEFSVDDEVVAPGGARGVVCDVREMTNGERVYGVHDMNGSVRYYTAEGIKRLLQ